MEGSVPNKSDFNCAFVACPYTLDVSVFMLIGNVLGNKSRQVVIMNIIIYLSITIIGDLI